jgi:hypothetical protein
MKESANFITAALKKIRSNANARLIFYILVTLAVILAFLALPDKGIEFIYNNF